MSAVVTAANDLVRIRATATATLRRKTLSAKPRCALLCRYGLSNAIDAAVL